VFKAKYTHSYLDIDGVEILPVDVLVLIVRWCKYADVSSINAADDIGEARFGVELHLLCIGFLLCRQANPRVHLVHQRQSHAVDCPAGGSLCHTEQFSDSTLKRARCVKPQSQHDL